MSSKAINNELISVVIPVYNVKQYVARCLDSVIAQSYSNIEILIVDDGSPDNCGEICDKYALQDSRIKVFHIPNGGVAKARQLGVEKSHGEYIVFVDPDDWLPLDSIEVLYSCMSNDIDIVIGSYTNYGNTRCKRQCLTERTIDNFLSCVLHHEIYPTPWGKLIRKNLFTCNSFPNFKKSQDWLMLIELSTRINKAKVINNSIYNYYLRETSTARTYKFDLASTKAFIEEGKNILINSNLYKQYTHDFLIFSLLNYNRLYSFLCPIDRKDKDINYVIEKIDYNQLSNVDKRLYLCIKHPVYNFVSKFIKELKWQIVNFLYYR